MSGGGACALVACSRWITGPGTWVVTVLGCAVLLSALLVVFSAHQTRTLYMESERLRLERDMLIARNGRLLLERSALSAYGRVERLASGQLAMRMPESGDMQLLARTEP